MRNFLKLNVRVVTCERKVHVYPHLRSNPQYHLAFYGCESPGYVDPIHPQKQSVWHCDPNSRFDPEGVPRGHRCGLVNGQISKLNDHVMNQWFPDTEATQPPTGVGFQVGGKTGIRYLILTVHYFAPEAFKKGERDESGFMLKMTKCNTTKKANLIMLEGKGRLLPRSVDKVEIAYRIPIPIILHPFTFFVHTHRHAYTHGSAYKVTPDGHWFLIGEQDVTTPAGIAPVADASMILRQGDVIAARCFFNNTSDRVIEMK